MVRKERIQLSPEPLLSDIPSSSLFPRFSAESLSSSCSEHHPPARPRCSPGASPPGVARLGAGPAVPPAEVSPGSSARRALPSADSARLRPAGRAAGAALARGGRSGRAGAAPDGRLRRLPAPWGSGTWACARHAREALGTRRRCDHTSALGSAARLGRFACGRQSLEGSARSCRAEPIGKEDLQPSLEKGELVCSPLVPRTILACSLLAIFAARIISHVL